MICALAHIDTILETRSLPINVRFSNLMRDLNIAVMEGVTFRNYNDEKRMENIEMIRVMTRLSPLDKLLMVDLEAERPYGSGHGRRKNDAEVLHE